MKKKTETCLVPWEPAWVRILSFFFSNIRNSCKFSNRSMSYTCWDTQQVPD